MEANEIRIGNIVMHNGHPIVVKDICSIGINSTIDTYGHADQTYWILFREISAIPLTEEWLKLFNFSLNKRDESVWDDNNITEEGYGTGYYFNIGEEYETYTDEDSGKEKRIATSHHEFYYMTSVITSEPILYVHEFQNMYYALTKKELVWKN